MADAFDKSYWESHWGAADRPTDGREIAASPYLDRELGGLAPGAALDAGCGEGSEAIWLAARGWHVTAADISTEALARASARAAAVAPGRLEWIEADLAEWEPEGQFDLVATHYAHPAMPQLMFYTLISRWVAPGGTLLIVGHRHTSEAPDHDHDHDHEGNGHGPTEAASVTAATVTAVLDGDAWEIVTADQPTRAVTNREGRHVRLDDVVVRAVRRR